jgi:hypothetical protein
MENRVFSTFEDDIRRGFLIRHPMPATTAAGAVNLVSTLPVTILEVSWQQRSNLGNGRGVEVAC